MKTIKIIFMTLLGYLLMAGVALAVTFESGSACGAAFYNASTCRGAFTPSTNTQVQLPPDGILHYSSMSIPNGVGVSFKRNNANTPVYILVSGNVDIRGTIDVGAPVSATHTGEAGNGNQGDDGQPGIGGPGGFDGGRGGLSSLLGGGSYQPGGPGRGPGGGNVGPGNPAGDGRGAGGGGGGYNGNGATGWYSAGGTAYGQWSLLPLIGGSGGGGGGAGAWFSGAGGGGGGGAILIAASGTFNMTYPGHIWAYGSNGGSSGGTYCGGAGGGGSGGAVRIVAENITGSGYWNDYWNGHAIGTYAGGRGSDCAGWGGNGAGGYVRIEANNITGWDSGWTYPGYSYALPGHVFVPNNPTLKIVSVVDAVAGTRNIPAVPTGNADVTFPTGTTAVTVNLEATGIPAGSTATVYVRPTIGAGSSSAMSGAFSTPDGNGILRAATSPTVNPVTLSPGNNVLLAAVTYTVTETIAMALPTFDNGERVAKIRVEGGMDGKSKVTYITASGKEYPADKTKAKA